MPSITMPGNFDRLVTNLDVVDNSGAADTELVLIPLPANSLRENGSLCWFRGFFFFANNANAKVITFRAADGTNTHNVTTFNSTSGNFYLTTDVFVYRISATSIRIEVVSNTFLLSATVLDLTANVLNLSWRAQGAASSDISKKLAFLAVWR